MDYDPSNEREFHYFETGYVISCDPKNCCCDVQTAEGNLLKNVPILNTFGSGGQSTDIGWTRKLRGCQVVLLNVQGVLCVLATVPTFGSPSDVIV